MEYHAVSGEELAQNIKISAFLRVMPRDLRQHVQLMMDDSATYSEIRETVVVI